MCLIAVSRATFQEPNYNGYEDTCREEGRIYTGVSLCASKLHPCSELQSPISQRPSTREELGVLTSGQVWPGDSPLPAPGRPCAQEMGRPLCSDSGRKACFPGDAHPGMFRGERGMLSVAYPRMAWEESRERNGKRNVNPDPLH